MEEEEKRDNKSLRCKLAKEIFKREALTKKINLLEHERDGREQSIKSAMEQIKELNKEVATFKQQVSIHKNRKEYMEYVADENEKDKKVLIEEKRILYNELQELKKANHVTTTLAKVANKVEWANTIKQTQTEKEQAQIFFDAYRLALGKEDEYKEKIESMR